MKGLKFYLCFVVAFICSLAVQAQSTKNIIVWQNGIKTEMSADSVTFVRQSGDKSDDDNSDYVDLGLSVKWAKCNVGASKPEDYGNYYAWGETTPKSNYSEDNYSGKNLTSLDARHDVATVVMGKQWRTPTESEMEELHNKCNYTWTTQNGVSGFKVTGPNGNSIFLPAAGYYFYETIVKDGTIGRYWTSTLNNSGTYNNAKSLNFQQNGGLGVTANNRRTYVRTYGYSVRAVTEK